MSSTFPSFVFTDLNPAVRDALADAFRGWSMGTPDPDVEVPLPQDFRLALPADAVVSPANAFGLMDGGFDAALTRHFGPELQVRAQAHIAKHYSGEQPIGTAFAVETKNVDCPFVIHAPTMRYPADIRGTLNAYYAFKAVLELCLYSEHEDYLDRIVCSGFGTLSGHLEPDVAARQMEGAYAVVRRAWNEKHNVLTSPAPLTQEQKWDDAVKHHNFVERLRGPVPEAPNKVTPEFVSRQQIHDANQRFEASGWPKGHDNLAEAHGR